MELDSRNKSRQARTMRFNSFETQEVREICQKGANEWRGLPILWIGIINEDFRTEEKECKDEERLKM